MVLKYLRFLLVVLPAAVCLCSSSASAGEEGKHEVARDLFKHGVKLYDRGEHEAAAAAFREAYKLRPSWKILFNLGQVEASLGRYGLAMEAFQKYLIQGKDEIPDRRRDEVSDEIRRLEPLVGEVEVDAPDKSSVHVDGVLRGTTPLKIPVLVVADTEHEIVIVFRDYEVHRETFSVWGGKSVDIKVHPKKIREAFQSRKTRVKKTKPAGEAAEEEHIIDEEPVQEEEADEELEKLDPLYFWIGVGAAGAFGVVTITLSVLADRKINEINDDPDNDSLRDEGKTMQKAGIAFLGLTGAALVGTGITHQRRCEHHGDIRPTYLLESLSAGLQRKGNN